MPSSVRSTCSSSTDRRRLSQSLNRVAVLGHLSGIDAAALPPYRTDSPMTVMQDRLRSLYGAPSIESLNSVDAVVTQMARPHRGPGTDDAPPPLTGPESGRRGQACRRNSLALSESAPSQRSTGSRTTTTSRSRARKETLSRQNTDQQQQPTVVSRPPLSHPELMVPSHVRARSEAAVRMGSTARKRQSMAMKGGQGRQSLAVAQPDWVAQTFQGSRFAPNKSSSSTTGQPQWQPEPSSARPERRSVSYNYNSSSSRRSSTATIVPESCAPVVPTTMSIVQNARRRSRASQSFVSGDEDDIHSVYSARSAATTSYAPRNFSRPMEQKQQKQYIVREQGVDFEMLNPRSSARTLTESSARASSFRALSVVIPPSQSSASSFSVRSVTRSTTPPPPFEITPSPARTTSSSSRESTASSEACTRTSTMSSATTVSSRSPSPAHDTYNPLHEKSAVSACVAQSSNGYQHRHDNTVRQHPSSLEPRDVKTLRGPRLSIVPPVTNTSFATRAAVDGTHHHHERAPTRMNRTLPHAHPDPLSYHPVELASARREKQPESSREQQRPRETMLLTDYYRGAVHAESPPTFDNSLQRSDSLFLGPKASSRIMPEQHEFFPSWTQHQQAQSKIKSANGVGIQPYRKLEGLGPVHAAPPPPRADDRRMLPSQKRVVSPPSHSLQRVAMTNAQVVRGPPRAGMMSAAVRPTSSRSLRKTTAIDFTKVRAGSDN
ncbi:hypothetical protein PFICI_01234 [Pestalotiopsis fici W106-1]|uniref:Uncharacterized protein n=1 Tax=Pestalotiopsis fici (strain W106-1 / CGMCC3.15140) TaxID=1229662 RepID=W3XQ76_PESFW|nr:uncharacterized protein PFICI_01234 [Pestalotiopsis fici W106-1]ETS87406.1 hypothetical protein PFICI_01234 [Pestalotiopsis fici W106-1]